MSKKDAPPEHKAYDKRFEIKLLRVFLYVVAVVYLVLVYGLNGSQFSGGFLCGAVGTFMLIQGIDLSQRRLVVIGGLLTALSVVLTISVIF